MEGNQQYNHESADNWDNEPDVEKAEDDNAWRNNEPKIEESENEDDNDRDLNDTNQQEIDVTARRRNHNMGTRGNR